MEVNKVLSIVNSFTEDQLDYVVAIAEAYEDLEKENKQLKEENSRYERKINKLIDICSLEKHNLPICLKVKGLTKYGKGLYTGALKANNKILEILEEKND